MYYPIDEAAARQANNANSMFDYHEGSTTAEYRRMVDAAQKIAADQKAKTYPQYHEKIDAAFDRYCKKLADYFNRSSRVDASCPSVLICGPSNFPVRKKEKQNQQRENLYNQWNDLKADLDRLCSIGTGGIQAGDPLAIERLTDKLNELQEEQLYMKRLNSYYRKNGSLIGCVGLSSEEAAWMNSQVNSLGSWQRKQPFPSYLLINNNANIKCVQQRINQIEKAIQADASTSTQTQAGVTLVKNSEIMRVQLIFEGKPDEETRTVLKSHGFRWSPKNSAWQRQLTQNGIYAAAQVIKAIAPE